MSFPTSHRLLRALLADTSYAWRPDGPDGDLRVVARRRNVSVETGRFPSESGAVLVEASLAAWQPAGPARRERLVLTAEGRARAALRCEWARAHTCAQGRYCQRTLSLRMKRATRPTGNCRPALAD